MKKINFALLPVWLLTVLFTATSCLSDDEEATTVSNDCIITSATLGVLNRYLHTTDKDGNDSIYKRTVTGAYFPLHIDQLGGRIFNTDSLPMGTDLTHTVFSAMGSQGIVAIRSLTTGNDTIFNTADSTDCSVERVLTVYTTGGDFKRTYRLSLCVHREEADSFVWKKVCTSNDRLAQLDAGHRTLVADGRIYVFGVRGNRSVVLTASTDAPSRWDESALPAGFDSRSVQRFGEGFVALADNRVVASADGQSWTPTGATLTPDMLVAAGTNRVFALKDGRFYRSADGVDWTEDGLDSPENVPVSDVAGLRLPSATDDAMESIVVTGRKADGTAVVWRKDIDLLAPDAFEWNYLPAIDDETYHCPPLVSTSLVAYDGAAVLAGNLQDGTTADFSMSRDMGRTWMPAEFINPLSGNTTGSMSVATDTDHFIWVVGNGHVWRGRLNRLGWATDTGIFE